MGLNTHSTAPGIGAYKLFSASLLTLQEPFFRSGLKEPFHSSLYFKQSSPSACIPTPTHQQHLGGSVTQSCLTLCNPWAGARQASLSFTISWSLLKLRSIESVMPSNHLILSSVIPFSSCLQSCPASGSFPMSQLFASVGQRIEASASALPMNIQG